MFSYFQRTTSMIETMELFRLLHDACESDLLFEDYYGIIPLLLQAHMGSDDDEDRLLLIIKLHQPQLQLGPEDMSSERHIGQVQSLRKDLNTLRAPFVTHIASGPNGICSVLHLAAVYFVQCAVFCHCRKYGNFRDLAEAMFGCHQQWSGLVRGECTR